MNLKGKITQILQDLQLDLKQKVVLTECATGAYAITPVLACLAGAEVYAVGKDTHFGTFGQAKQAVENLLSLFPEKAGKVYFVEELTSEILAKADIITNSGHLRPLDAQKLEYTKKGVVIPLMYENWEFRSQDLDLAFCQEHHILVAGTNERHPDVDVFNYLGDMALKFIFDAGLCLYQNTFVLICNNDFGGYIAKILAKNCQKLGIIDKTENKEHYANIENCEWLSDYPKIDVPQEFRKAEAIIYTAYPFDTVLLGEADKPIPLSKLVEQFEAPYLLRYAGDIDAKLCDKLKIAYYPKEVKSGHMGIIPSEIGNDAVYRLQGGGLKVGELMLKHETHYKHELLAQMLVL
jgi:hypothetical protein